MGGLFRLSRRDFFREGHFHLDHAARIVEFRRIRIHNLGPYFSYPFEQMAKGFIEGNHLSDALRASLPEDVLSGLVDEQVRKGNLATALEILNHLQNPRQRLDAMITIGKAETKAGDIDHALGHFREAAQITDSEESHSRQVSSLLYVVQALPK